MIQKRNSSELSDLKVGVLFNSPVVPSRGEDIDYVADAEVEEQVETVERVLEKLDIEHQRLPLGESVESLVEELKAYSPDVVINLCEGAFGDSHLEMNVPLILELLKIPYTGSPPLTLGLCQNKGLTKDVLKAKKIPTPHYQVLNRSKDWKGKMSYPLFVKPLSEDGSIGITKESFVRDDVELEKRVKYIVKRYRQLALVEKYIYGRELNVAILGNTKMKVLPISEIMFKFSDEPKIVDYSAKWLKESEEYKKTVPICPAELEPSLLDLVEREALQTYAAMGCRDYARIDIRLKRKTPYVLEVNPNPDISQDGGFVRSLRAAGISYEEFIQEIICSALRRRNLTPR
jgi:D-alanine-D-alanine ligase